MSFPPPYRSGNREWKKLSGIERAARRFGGELLGFKDSVMQIRWPAGVQDYPVVARDGYTEIELQLYYDVQP